MTTAAELAGATDSEITEARTALVTHLSSAFPTLAIKDGPLTDLIIGPSADALAAVEHRATNVQSSLDPSVALASGSYDTDILNAALAGLGVTRKSATKATGSIALQFSTNTQRTIAAGLRFTSADGVGYLTTSTIRFLPTTGTAISTSDVVLIRTPANLYVGTISVSAETTGADANKPAGTTLTATSTISGLNSTYATTDLSGGADAETDAALLARLPASSAPRTVASISGAEGVVINAYAYSATTVIGYGHTGMRRGRSVLTGQTPGRMDIRTRISGAPHRLRLSVTATYIGTVGPYGQWRFLINRGDASGWFKIERVIQVGAVLTSGGYTPTITTGFDITNTSPTPDIRNAEDAFFSFYSTASITFIDPDTSTAGLIANSSTKTYEAVIRLIPGIEEAQTACDATNARAAGGDCVVRAAAPVMVSVNVTATQPTGITLTQAEVADAVARAINATLITSTLNGSTVGAKALTYLSSGTLLQLSNWAGVVYNIDGTTTSITGTTGLTVATAWGNGLGNDSVAFYCDDSSVTVTIN